MSKFYVVDIRSVRVVHVTYKKVFVTAEDEDAAARIAMESECTNLSLVEYIDTHMLDDGLETVHTATKVLKVRVCDIPILTQVFGEAKTQQPDMQGAQKIYQMYTTPVSVSEWPKAHFVKGSPPCESFSKVESRVLATLSEE